MNARLEKKLRFLAVLIVASAIGGIAFVFAKGPISASEIASGIAYGLLLGAPLAGISVFVLEGPLRPWLGSLSFAGNLIVRSAIYAVIIVPILFLQLGDVVAGTPVDPTHKTFWSAAIYSLHSWCWPIWFRESPTSSDRARS